MSNTNTVDRNNNLLSNNSLINVKSSSCLSESNILTIYSPRFLIEAGQSKKFQVIQGFDSKGNPIQYSKQEVIWKTTVGKIDSTGLLKTPISCKDQYILVSATIDDLTIFYSFHTTGTHEYIVYNNNQYLPYISEEVNKLLNELSYLMDEGCCELIISRLKNFEIDNFSLKELFEWIEDYLATYNDFFTSNTAEDPSINILLDELLNQLINHEEF
ncbi:MAG: hypothetical protein ACRC2S_12255 [Waterburya sp.]